MKFSYIVPFFFLIACDSGASDAEDNPKIAACQVSCDKACQCGTNLCSDSRGVDNGCVRACAGLEGNRGDTDAYNECMATASCDQVLAGQCLGLNQ